MSASSFDAVRPLLAWASDHFSFPLPAAHPFPLAKYALVRKRLLADGVLEPAWVTRSLAAPEHWLHAAHDVAYVSRTLTGGWAEADVRSLGLPWSDARDARTRRPLRNGRGRARRPFVLDLDVHQGNGTAACFAGDASVFTFSLHARHNYPVRKESSTLDVELDDGAGDDQVLAALDANVPATLDAHTPDLVFYQAGVDALATDRLGRLRMTHAGLGERDRRVFAWLEARGLPVCVTLGGGYGQPIEDTVEAHVNVWRAARVARKRWPAVTTHATPARGARS